ncbi:MAG: NAD(P)H-dependent oxidoreductase [Arenicella sp.]|nr:NAD(P)H-dependent oxidoreductase [Arenicella sp.]
MRNILIIQGHPDAKQTHFCHAIAEKYASAAHSASHAIQQITVAELDFPILRTQQDFDQGEPCDDIKHAQAQIKWADHVLVIYPLWLGDMPALLKGFFEQAFRPGFALEQTEGGKSFTKLLAGKSARIVVTMGMPAFVYRWFFKAHTVKNLKRNILTFCGFSPVNTTLIGSVYAGNDDALYDALSNIAHLGRIAK